MGRSQSNIRTVSEPTSRWERKQFQEERREREERLALTDRSGHSRRRHEEIRHECEDRLALTDRSERGRVRQGR